MKLIIGIIRIPLTLFLVLFGCVVGFWIIVGGIVGFPLLYALLVNLGWNGVEIINVGITLNTCTWICFITLPTSVFVFIAYATLVVVGFICAMGGMLGSVCVGLCAPQFFFKLAMMDFSGDYWWLGDHI